MAILTDKNLTSYNKYLTELKQEINKWKSYLSSAEKTINSSTGSTFRTEYAKGKKATNNVKTIIDILQSLEKDLNNLIKDADAFYQTSVKASKK